MPFVSTTMTGLMAIKATSLGMVGSKSNPILSATSSAVCTYIPSAAVVMSTNVVTGPGSGTYTGKIVGCVPSVMSSLMLAKSTSSGLVGRDTKRLFDAISFGVCQTLRTLVIAQGTVIGGGPGAGQGKIVNLVPGVLEQMIVANLTGKRLLGSKTMPIFLAIAFGICQHLMISAIVLTTCIGAFFPPPAGPIVIPNAAGLGKLM